MNIKALLESRVGVIIISVLLGLGVAALFRSVCKDGKCVIVNGPPKEEINNYYYKINENCYKYTPVASECTLG
jgi:hypothetical protein